MQRRVLVATTDGLHQLGDGDAVSLAGHEVSALASDGSGWWAIIDGHEIWRSPDGAEWARAAVVSPLRANCVLPTARGVFVGTSESHVYALQDETVEPVQSFDEVEGRDTWHTPWGGPPDVRSLSALGDGDVYANVHVGGIPRSADGGATWAPTIDIASDVHQVYCDPASGLVLAASARGLGVSSDSGASWRFDTEGLHARYMRAVTVAGDTILATASTGPRGDRAAVYRKPVDGASVFERCIEGLPEWFPGNVDTYRLDADGPDAVFGTSEGSVFVSSDEAESWTLAAEGLPSVRAVALA